MLPLLNMHFTSSDVALTYTGNGNYRGLWSFPCYCSDTKTAVLDEQNRSVLVSETQPHFPVLGSQHTWFPTAHYSTPLHFKSIFKMEWNLKKTTFFQNSGLLCFFRSFLRNRSCKQIVLTVSTLLGCLKLDTSIKRCSLMGLWLCLPRTAWGTWKTDIFSACLPTDKPVF